MNTYLCINRPPEHGIPAGSVSRDSAPREVNGRHVHGTVTYDAPLSFEQVWRFDLRPADEAEAAHYTFWLEAERDEVEAEALLQEYLETSPETLQHLAKRDYLAEQALLLQQP